jgi:hypothetical protein
MALMTGDLGSMRPAGRADLDIERAARAAVSLPVRDVRDRLADLGDE